MFKHQLSLLYQAHWPQLSPEGTLISNGSFWQGDQTAENHKTTEHYNSLVLLCCLLVIPPITWVCAGHVCVKQINRSIGLTQQSALQFTYVHITVKLSLLLLVFVNATFFSRVIPVWSSSPKTEPLETWENANFFLGWIPSQSTNTISHPKGKGCRHFMLTH